MIINDENLRRKRACFPCYQGLSPFQTGSKRLKTASKCVKAVLNRIKKGAGGEPPEKYQREAFTHILHDPQAPDGLRASTALVAALHDSRP